MGPLEVVEAVVLSTSAVEVVTERTVVVCDMLGGVEVFNCDGHDIVMVSPAFTPVKDNGDVVVELKVTLGLPAVVTTLDCMEIASQSRPVKLNHGRFTASRFAICCAVVLKEVVLPG